MADKNNRLKKNSTRLMQIILSIALGVSTFATSPEFAFAQAVGPSAGAEEKAELSGTRKQLATIVFAGLAGAIFGLSTLSFYGRPQDHLSNIAIGFALGVIGGASYTTYKAATQPYDAFDISQRPSQLELPYAEKYATASAIQPRIGWQWSF